MLTAGCYTTVSVSLRNRTPTAIRVWSSESNREVEVAPEKFKKLPHSSGDLIVSTKNDGTLRFVQIAPFNVDRKYHTIKNTILGPNSVTLNLTLETNMQIYVVMPDRKSVDEKVEQPAGYPKVAEKLGD